MSSEATPAPIAPAIWRQAYPEGVPAEIDADAYSSLVDLFERSVAEYAERPAYTNMGKTITFAELERASAAFAAFLQSRGVRVGDAVTLMMPNALAYPVALFGALRAGAAVINTNPLYTPRELSQHLADSRSRTVVVLENMAATLAATLSERQVDTVVIARLGDLQGRLHGALVNLVVKRVKKLVPPYRIPGAVTLPKALAIGARRRLEPVEVGPADIAFLQYTGGTTGRPKAAMLTHRNLVANLEQSRAWFLPAMGEGQHTMVTALPLYHVFALTVNCLLMLRCGGRNLLITNPRDMDAFIADLARERFTLFTGVNTLFAGLLAQPKLASVDFSALRLSVAGGMAAQRTVGERWREVTGTTLIEGYGLTEASPVCAANPVTIDRFTGAVGVPLPSTEVAVRDFQGNDLGVGEVGELHFRGPQVMRGYWEKPEETAKVLGADGFLATGDIGMVQPDGYVKVVDRAKDMILVSGFNVYPNEVEEVAVACPGVHEAAVIGLPDEHSGEIVVLYAVRSDPGLTEEVLRAHLIENLARYKVPKRIEFRADLPKSPVGKVLRRLLREEVASR